MIDGLIGGKLYGKRAQRTNANGKTFVTAKVRVPTSDNDSIFVSVIAFSETVASALLALDSGDSVSLSGSLTPKVWTNRDGAAHPALDMVAHTALSAYHVARKRKANEEAPE